MLIQLCGLLLLMVSIIPLDELHQLLTHLKIDVMSQHYRKVLLKVDYRSSNAILMALISKSFYKNDRYGVGAESVVVEQLGA